MRASPPCPSIRRTRRTPSTLSASSARCPATSGKRSWRSTAGRWTTPATRLAGRSCGDSCDCGRSGRSPCISRAITKPGTRQTRAPAAGCSSRTRSRSTAPARELPALAGGAGAPPDEGSARRRVRPPGAGPGPASAKTHMTACSACPCGPATPPGGWPSPAISGSWSSWSTMPPSWCVVTLVWTG
jgi:hypothetical protein